MARLVYKWTQDEEGDRSWILWTICGNNAQHFSRKGYYRFFILKYVLSCPMLMKFKRMLDQRNMSGFAVTARVFWKPFRPPEQSFHWYDSAKRRCMISLPDTQWGCIGPLDMRCGDMKSFSLLLLLLLFIYNLVTLGYRVLSKWFG